MDFSKLMWFAMGMNTVLVLWAVMDGKVWLVISAGIGFAFAFLQRNERG